MKFYKVPKLGAFMAVPLVYNSCQLEDALDNAVNDYLDCQKRREEQAKLKEEWEEEKARERDEKEKEGVPYEPEEKEFEQIEEKEFDIAEESFVVCLDTLGQDKELTDDDKRFVLRTVKAYKEQWEDIERCNLEKDREKRLKTIGEDKDFNENEQPRLLDDEERFVEDQMATREDIVDDEMKELEIRKIRLKFLGQILGENEMIKAQLLSLTNYKVLKMQRVVQSAFYFLRYDREVICEAGTNKLFWKEAKKSFNDEFLKRLMTYSPSGSKTDEYKRYWILNFIERNLSGIEQETVDAYSGILGRLFKWVQQALAIRKDDILRRKIQKRKEREERAAKML